MKNLFIIITLLFSVSIYSQAPQSFKYQATARSNSGDLIINQSVGMQISIIQGSASGSPVYIETFSPTTNEFGLININIGTGNTTVDFSSIKWANGPYFIKIEMDVAGGTNYQDFGTSQLLSVPYALHANSSSTTNYSFNPTSPSGFQNLTPLTHEFIGNDAYTVPSGKLLYILNYRRGSSSWGLAINDITVASRTDAYLCQPIIADENELITGGYGATFNGYLIDK